MKLYYRLLHWWYWKIRWIFVPDYNINEDYNCMYCGKPVLRRYLYCSQKCTDADFKEMCE